MSKLPPAKPTPVRNLMGEEEASEQPESESPPPRTFSAEGEAWIVRVTGSTIAGTAAGVGAVLSQVRFFRPSDPAVPVRQTFLASRELEDLYDEELVELLARGKPVAPPKREEGPRPGKPGRRRGKP